MNAPPTETSLLERLREVWRRERRLHRNTGWLVFGRWLLGLFLLGLAIDWLFKLPVGGRVLLLVVLFVVALVKGWQAGWRHLRRFDAARTALMVEQGQGGMESLLVTAVQLGESEKTPGGSGGSGGTSEALRALTRRKAEDRADDVRPKDTVSFAALRRLGLLLLIPLLLIAGLAVFNGPLLAAGLGRIFAPWLAIDYPTRTQLGLDNDDPLIVKEGDGIRLVGQISGEVPKQAKIILRTGSGKPRERKLTVQDAACAYEAETVFRSFDYRFAAGDAQSEWHAVQVISSPRIERAEVRLTYPEYTGRAEETVQALTLTVPEGTTIDWSLTLDRAVDKASFQPAGGAAKDLEISADGRSVSLREVANESRAYHFDWIGKEHGFAYSSPRHYLQVAPDQEPSVELRSPDGNLYATLGRDLAFAYRGRDDHGIGQAELTYRVNKTAMQRVELPVPENNEGSEATQAIDWNYREALPDLAVGDTVSFAVELADRYPGADGPHRARSDARRVQFLSEADYLAQIEKQKRRLLAQIRTIYREERGVHELVRGLDPNDEIFVQTCQLEAVRQDLIRERLAVVQDRLDKLVDDLAANKVTNQVETAALVQLGADLNAISDEHITRAASELRNLAAVDGTATPTDAVQAINRSARELGLVVLQLGFAEASDVMARELHATAQSQAGLRRRTLVGGDEIKPLAAEQSRLAEETERLLAATPRNQESTPRDALIAFKLSRMVNQLLRSGADEKMRDAAKHISADESEPAARRQAEVIADLLRAEFRLRTGAEFEALTKAGKLFDAQADAHRRLRGESEASNEERAAAQSTLQRQLQVLLMPEVPAPPARLYDAEVPAAPPVGDLLAKAESAMASARRKLDDGERESAATFQQEAANAFGELAAITRKRQDQLVRQQRMTAVVRSSGKVSAQLLLLEERLLLLLEQTEDAADDEIETTSLAAQNQGLADDFERLAKDIARRSEAQSIPAEDDLPLLDSLARVAGSVRAATPLLKGNQPDPAIEQQEAALDSIEEALELTEGLTQSRSAFANVLDSAAAALAPSPLLVEIESEQEQLSKLTEDAEDEARDALIIPQKNLIHAVDAVLTSLDPLAHRIESGTVMLFAKEDMDAAAIGLETDDIDEAIDAQSFVVESLQDLRAKIDQATPEYRYVREVIEHLYGVVPQGAVIRTGARQRMEEAEKAPEAEVLRTKARGFGEALQTLTGNEDYTDTADELVEALADNKADDIEDLLDVLSDQTADMQLLMENLAYLLTPPPNAAIVPEDTPEVKLINQALAVAAPHHELARETRSAAPDQLAKLAPRQAELASRCKALLPESEPHELLVAASGHLAEAAAQLKAGEAAAASAAQTAGDDALRHFILEYTLAFVDVPPPPPPEDSAPSDDADPEEGELQLFMPGALTGERPKGGRLEWQVLGRRDRAALNENFARELPLEYRAILKDYYQRLTQ